MTDTDALVEAVAKAIQDTTCRVISEDSLGVVATSLPDDECVNAARAALSAIEAAGWRVVPVEPTQEMIEAGLEGEVVRDSSGTSWRSPTAYVYSAMLSAAPRIGGEK